MIDFKINAQPDDESCGPTCLHALYQHYNHELSLTDLVKNISRSHSGGTLAPFLGSHALSQGFTATICVNNLSLFDPSWFSEGEVSPECLIAKLSSQMKYKRNKSLLQLSEAYIEYLQLGGIVRFDVLCVDLLKHYFALNHPILTGLSATYLYESPRERFQQGISVFDDIRGTPCGHFVVLCGYDEEHDHFVVADPSRQNPLSKNHSYHVNSTRLINAILLGVLTYDANLLIIEPKGL